MVLEGLSAYFLNPAGLATALVLVPFLVLYLIRPKPRRETIPSLLFVMKDMGRSNVNSLFRNFLKDLLVLFHLLFLFLLIAAAAKPYVNVPRSALVEQTVLLLDVSASMHANGDARFAELQEHAIGLLGRENTIILVKTNPEVLAERVSASEAEELIDDLEPTETGTDLSGALQAAAGYATTGSRVVVLSDFLPTVGDLDYDTAADTIEAQGALVEYVPITSQARNVGIIDLLVGPVTSTVWVKNYDARPAQVTLRVSDAEQQVLLAGGETKEVDFKTPAGVAEIVLPEEDDFDADNRAWTSAPEKNNVRVLVITNDKAGFERSNFLLALNVIQKNFPTTFEIEYGVPPKIPDLEHDVYVLYKANLDFVLPGYIKELEAKTEAGAAVIAFSQPGLFSIDWQGLLPVQAASDPSGGLATLDAPQVTTLTKDLDFGQTGSYVRVVADEGASIVAAADRDPLIVLGREGRGHVLYYGLEDDKASFSLDPSYPVFWRRTFDLLTNRPSIENLNLRTGAILALPGQQPIKTPNGKVTTNLLPLEHVGLYALPDRTVAVNLLSDGESRLATPAVNNTQRANADAANEKAPKDVSSLLLWAAICLLFLELLYVKYRGDF